MEDLRCALFGDPRRPAVCASLRAEPLMCGDEHDEAGREHALVYLKNLELATRPDKPG
jgi:hypothetical protein